MDKDIRYIDISGGMMFAVVSSPTRMPEDFQVRVFDTFDEAVEWGTMNPDYITQVVPVMNFKEVEL